MIRQTAYTVDRLIELCDSALKNDSCSDCGSIPTCMLINELGICAVDNDKKAQSYLIGLLSSKDQRVTRILLFVSFCKARPLQ